MRQCVAQETAGDDKLLGKDSCRRFTRPQPATKNRIDFAFGSFSRNKPDYAMALDSAISTKKDQSVLAFMEDSDILSCSFAELSSCLCAERDSGDVIAAIT